MVRSSMTPSWLSNLANHGMMSIGTKHIVSFFFAASVLIWVQMVGYVEAFGTTAGVFALILGGGMAVLIPFGARIRHRQANWRIIL